MNKPLASVHGDNDLDYWGNLVLTRGLGHDPHDHSGENFQRLPHTKLVRLNNGYGPEQGTIPLPQHYGDFAVRVGNFVEASQGCSIWCIGNEMNFLAVEAPQGQPITPGQYAECFTLCRDEIKSRPFHSGDQVCIGAVAPWNNTTTYLGNPDGSWIRYFEDIQHELGVGGCDGFFIHSYVREQTVASITDPAKMQAPFQECYWGFLHYINWMAAILPRFQGLPVYMTEFCVAGEPWLNVNTGVIRAAYQEIDRWNQARPNRGIHVGPTVYRWSVDKWRFDDKPEVQDDFTQAAELKYTFPPGEETEPPKEEDMLNPSLEKPYYRDGANSTVEVAHDWTYFASDGKPPERDGPCQLPEYKAILRADDPHLVFDGDTSQCWFIRWKIFDAGIYQRIAVTQGASYEFDAMAKAWCTDGNDETVSDGDMHVMLGIDPTGGIDPWAESIVWTDWKRVGVDYQRHESQIVKAQGRFLTVFIRAWNKWELSHNDVYVDDCHLTKQGGGQPPGGGDVDYNLIRQIVREELDRTTWASGT